jgi:hypothetical protein
MSSAFKLQAADEWTAHDPFGRVKSADARSSGTRTRSRGKPVALRAARGGYASFRVVVHGHGRFRLDCRFHGELEADLYRTWYHPVKQRDGRTTLYYPDALVPAGKGQEFAIPDPDNRISGQTVQEFWVDVFVPPDAEPGQTEGLVRLTAGRDSAEFPVSVAVVEKALPDQPCIVFDHNSYGCRWLIEYYPKTLGPHRGRKHFWHKASELIHHYFRMAHEHRGLFHNLGYGHSGQFDPIYGPRTTGYGRNKQLVDWELFDRHHGPLLDGTAFRVAPPGMPKPRQSDRPVWAVYAPINPDWPASYLWWGEPGYEVEFTRCVGQFDAHLRDNGWTKTQIEFFFNHKKRYRWFEWDGDEVKHAKDDAYHLEMIRLWEKATAGSPVKWVYRADVSWQMKGQFERLGGHRNLWNCGGFCAWYPEEIRRVLARGEIVTTYGGCPRIDAASTDILQNLYHTWARGLHGFCAWLTPRPGPDPWFDCDGAETGIFYPGERFGIAGPLPSIRLKLLRNGIQDLDMLDQEARRKGRLERTRKALIDAVGAPVWGEPPRVARELPPEEWDSINLGIEHEPIMAPSERLGSGWWAVVRDAAFSDGTGDASSHSTL